MANAKTTESEIPSKSPRSVKQCNKCDKVFSRNETLQRHINITHHGRVFICDKCGDRTVRFEDRKRHSKSHSGGTTFTTTFEGEKPAKVPARKSQNDEFMCNQCDKSFRQRSALSEHVMSTHRGRIFTCDKCGHTFKRHCDKYLHGKTHPGGTTFTITYHGERSSTENGRKLKKAALKNFPSEWQRKSNRRTPQSVRCKQCEKSFSHKMGLHEHVTSVHKGRIFTCDKCGHKSKFLSAKSKHGKTHPEGTTFTVSFQGDKSFTQNCRNLDRDRRKSDKPEFKPDLRMEQPTPLKSQPKSMEPEGTASTLSYGAKRSSRKPKPKYEFTSGFRCDSCSEIFADKNVLEKHMRDNHSIDSEWKKTYGTSRRKFQRQK